MEAVAPATAVIPWGAFRTFVHRRLLATGDRELAAELDALVGRGTRSTAVAVVDMDAQPPARFAFIGADAATRFEIGSITKGLTGMLLADSVERGELSLDSDVGAVVSDLAGTRFGSVTAKELCTHTAGLPRIPRSPAALARAWWSVVLGRDPYRGTTTPQLLRLAARQRLGHRGRHRYSNLGAAVLGQLMAIKAGTDYRSLLAERILRPIGMTASTVASEKEMAPRGWSSAGRRQRPWVMDAYAPAGGVVSTIGDMARLAMSLLDGSAPGHQSVLPLDGVEADRPDRASGMLWIVDSMAGTEQTMVWHNGQTGGYSAFFVLLPAAHRAVVVLANVARATEQQRIALALARGAGNPWTPDVP